MTDLESGAADGTIAGRSSMLPTLMRWGLSPIDLVGLLIVAISVVAFAPPLLFDAWTVRLAAVVVCAPVGLALVVSYAWRRDRPALVLIAAMLWVLFVSMLSGAARSALLGSAGRDLSALTVISCCSLWGIGRAMSDRGRSLLTVVLVAASGASASVGLLQVVLGMNDGNLAMLSGRPTGFSVNPVYYGALSAAGLLVAVDRWRRAAWPWWTVATLVLGIGVSISGSRVALAAAVVLLTACLAIRRSRDAGISVVLAVASIAVGVIIDRTAGAGRNAADRLTSGDGGGRTAVWRYGVESFTDRPIVGYGFGRFRPAVQSRFSVDFVRLHAPDDFGQAWFDAHNVVILMLVAVGAVGTALFGAWAFMWCVQARGPLVWACAAVVLHWMLQPVSMLTLPVAMLAFGASRSDTVGPGSQPMVGRRVKLGCATAGLVAGLLLLAGDAALQRSTTIPDTALAERAAVVFVGDPVVSDVVAQVIAASGGPLSDDELDWRLRAVRAEPDRPYWWTQLATAYYRRDRFDEAQRAVEQALELQSTNVRALRTSAIIAIARADEAALRDAFERLCALGQPECEVEPADVLAAASP